MSIITDSPPRSTSWAVLAMVSSFAFAFGVDQIIRQLRLYAGSTFRFLPFILISALLPILVVAMILALAVLVLQRLPPSLAVGATFLVAGIAVALVYLSFLVPYPMWLRGTFLYRFQHALVGFGSQSALYYLASAWMVIGVAALRRTRRLGAA